MTEPETINDADKVTLLWNDLEKMVRSLHPLAECEVRFGNDERLVWCRPTDPSALCRVRRICYVKDKDGAKPIAECSLAIRIKAASAARSFINSVHEMQREWGVRAASAASALELVIKENQ